MKWLDEFLAVFGNYTIAQAVVVIGAFVFLFLIYKQVKKYFTEKAEALKQKVEAEIKEKDAREKAEKDRDEKLGKAMDAIGEYPEYRKQSLEVQRQLTKSINGVKASVGEVAKMVDMNEIKRIRAEIFAFADSCKLGERHTEDGFLHIIDIHEDYEALLEKYKMTNGRISVDYEYIMSVYRELRDKGTFSERKV